MMVVEEGRRKKRIVDYLMIDYLTQISPTLHESLFTLLKVASYLR